MDRTRLLHEMGLGPVWKLRRAEAVVEEAVVEKIPAALPAQVAAAAVPVLHSLRPNPDTDWDALAATVAACRQCRLCEARKQAVLGVGDRHADWLFVGEGPGAEEDEKGEPFVGQAGKLLDNMLAAIGLRRGEDVYIANAVKCRPPQNRTPEAEEIAVCRPYLERQIALLQPKLIVALGRPAAQSLLQTEVKIASARGRVHDYHGIPLIVTYHPAYLLRTPLDKAKAWEDLCFMRRTMKTLKETS
jgi:DNA polymerase